MSSFSAHNNPQGQTQSQANLHEFSASYQARKQALISEYAAASEHACASNRPQARASSQKHANTRIWPRWQIAAAVAAICMLVPAGAWALSSNTEFFDTVFGNAGRTNVGKQVVQESEYGTVVAPSREYVAVDAEQAERLLAESISSDPVIIERGGHTLTVNAMVRSQNAMVMSYTLERPEGVTALQWSDNANATKGASPTEDTPLYWLVKRPGNPVDNGTFVDEMTYVDPTRSSDTLLHCYSYMLFSENIPAEEALELYVEWADEGSIYDARTAGTLRQETIPLPARNVVDAATFTSNDSRGGTATISPLSIEITAPEIANDENSYVCDLINTVTINFTDNTQYIISSDSDLIDNAMVSFGYGENHEKLGFAFNRLVDPATIATITVTTHAGETFSYRA